jgi:parvulin-like peptidyl-prolyl isomerase
MRQLWELCPKMFLDGTCCLSRVMSYAFLWAIIVMPLNTHAQVNTGELRRLLGKVKNEEDAISFMRTHQDIPAELRTVDPRSDSTALTKAIFSHHEGEIVSFKLPESSITTLFKILKIEKIETNRVQYIFLDNEKTSMRKIDSLRALIMKRLKSGEPFEKLAEQYSMDSNAKRGGDLGWFDEGVMVKQFQNAVRKHRVGEFFKVDVNDEQWYYVVKKTHEPREVKKARVLFIEILQP